jgi:ribose-phosphate pyrophosphokinase
MESFRIFSGTANPALADEIARELGVRLGNCDIARFPDGEAAVQLLEPIRRQDVFLVQPTSPPVDEHLVELLALVDACRRAAAARITVVAPYFGYARMDKRHDQREPITASMVATILQAVGVDHLITVDLHAPQIEGFSVSRSIACRRRQCWRQPCAAGWNPTPSSSRPVPGG